MAEPFSSRWRGFWDEFGFGRQEMHELELRFDQGQVTGRGRDCVGRFTFAGTYDEKFRISLVKQYIGRHQVLYRGQYDGEGVFYGTWHIGALSGKFALRPERTVAATAGDAAIDDEEFTGP